MEWSWALSLEDVFDGQRNCADRLKHDRTMLEPVAWGSVPFGELLSGSIVPRSEPLRSCFDTVLVSSYEIGLVGTDPQSFGVGGAILKLYELCVRIEFFGLTKSSLLWGFHVEQSCFFL